MTIAGSTELQDAIGTLAEAAEQALVNECPDDFEAIERSLDGVDDMAREIQQALWADDIEDAIRRLEANEPLSDQCRQAIRAFMISDAEQYLAHENNLESWVDELRRLLADIGERAGSLDRDSIGALRGVLKDAARLVPDIRNYFEERRRIERFDVATGKLDSPMRKALITLLREQFGSPHR